MNFLELFKAKSILLWCYLTHSWEDKGVHAFPKSICPKVNAIAWLVFKLVYFNIAVQLFNHYTMRTPPSAIWHEITNNGLYANWRNQITLLSHMLKTTHF